MITSIKSLAMLALSRIHVEHKLGSSDGEEFKHLKGREQEIQIRKGQPLPVV
jgi:hypothetical protein